MNFFSKFDGGLPFTGTHPKAQTHVDTARTQAPSDAVVVKDADLLFNGDFKRSGADLIIVKDDRELVLSDYFKGEKRAPLASSDGAYLTGKLVDALTGHVQMAQADGSASAAKIIGHVTKLTGNATVIRNGVSIILNNGDNVHQGDVVQSGSNSTLGITFIDGSVFGLGSNARMVLNEMVYDPNGSGNSSLLSLVQGTISFVAGATAKHGDMKVDTPVATMGIRGTAVLVEIDFEVTVPGSAPPARFQVLVEPDGTTGSYVLLDRVTLAPIATVNQAGTVTTVSGQGTVSFLASAQLAPETLKLINEVFSQKFTDNSNPKSNTHFTDSPIPDNTFPVKFASGDIGTATVRVIAATDGPAAANLPVPKALDHIPGPPKVVTSDAAGNERALLTGSSLINKVSGGISYADINIGDVPTAQAAFGSFSYRDSAGDDVTSTLTPAQLSAINAVAVPLAVVQDPQGKNVGTATWTYSVPDHAFDFIADGETLTLTYIARVDNNFAPHNEVTFAPFTITITGTNDLPTIVVGHTTAVGTVVEDTNVNSAGEITANGVISFDDADLTDTHTASFEKVSSTSAEHLPGFTDNSTYIGTFALTPVSEDNAGPESGGELGWTFTLDEDDPILQSLAEGQTITQVYRITVSDGHGGTVTQDVTITITGTNDSPNHPPVIVGELTTATGSVTEDIDVNASHQIAADGTIVFRDIDLIDAHEASFTKTSSTSDAHLPNFIDNTSYIGTFSLEPVSEDLTDTNNLGSVGWTFTLDDCDPILQSLAVNQTITQVYTVSISDGHGGTVTQDVTITIHGTNDAPEIVANATAATGSVTEDSNVSGHDIGTSGTIGFSDVDLIDHHTASFEPLSSSSDAHLPGFTGNSTYIGTFTLDPVSENATDTDPAGSVGWTFTLDDCDPILQSLAVNQSIKQVYRITLSDGHGGTTYQDVTVTINGANDAPEIVANATAATGSVTEDTNVSGHDIGTSGTIGFSDVDLIDHHTASFAQLSSSSNAQLPGFTGNSTYIGTFTLDPVNEDTADANDTGSVGWTFTLDNCDPLLQSMTVNESITQTYRVTISDGHGGSTYQDVTVTIHGINDAPVVAAALSDAADEGDAAFDRDLLTGASDVDHGETATLSVTNLTYAVDGGSASSTLPDGLSLGSDGHTLTIDPSHPAFNYLACGESTSIVVSYDVTDVHGATVHQTETITIHGTNDAPAIVGESDPATHGIMVVSPASIIVEPAGHNTNSLGLNTETFNSNSAGPGSTNGAGSGNFTSTALGATFSSSGHAGIMHGSSSVSAAPFMGPGPGSPDTTNYLSIGAGSSETITFTQEYNAFGLYWGSVDTYNTIKFYDGATLVASFTGADVSPLLANGNQGSFASNGYVEFVLSHDFNKVVLSSSSNAFEIDNISAGNVPASHAVLEGTVSGTMSVHDPDVGDTLTGLVTGNATVLYNNSTTLPNGVDISDLIKAGNITFDSVQSDGGTSVLHWNYDPHDANFDFLHAGDVLKLSYTAQVSDGHGSAGNQQITVTLVGADKSTNVKTLQYVDGTTGNDTFNNVGGNTTVFGNGGHDNFVFKSGSGSATIADFQPGDDTITFASSMFSHNPANVLAAAHDDGHGNTVISLAGGDTITLQHVQAAHLSSSDFHFV